jgi:hypothetical protein
LPFLAPVVGGIVGAITAIGSTALGAFALNLGGSLLLSAASSALMRGRETGAAPIQGRMVSVREPVASRRMIYGRARVGGTIVYMSTKTTSSDRANNELYLVVALSGHRVKSIGAVYLNGELAFDAAGNAQPRFAGNIGLEKHLGVGAGSPFPELRGLSGGEWTADHRLVGCAAIAIRFNYNADIYPSGVPNVTVDIEGKDDVYDPRTGVSGYTENPALCVADYMAHPLFGVRAQLGADDGIPLPELIAAANICDETVAKVGGGTEPRYSMNGVIDTGAQPVDVITDMLTAFAGSVVYQSGQWRIYAGAWRPASATLTADDLVAGGIRSVLKRSRAQNFNGVRGKFVSPENDWVADDFPAYASNVYLAEDKGERVWADIELPFTISASMAQRLAKIHLESQRRQIQVTFAGKLSAWRAAVMDTVNLTYPRHGYTDKPFTVVKVGLEIGDYIQPTLALEETSPLIWDWSASEAQIYQAAPRTTLPSAYDVAAPNALTVTEDLYETRNSVKARAVISWNAAPSAFVTDYDVQTREPGGEWQLLGRTSDLMFEHLDVPIGAREWRVSGITRIGVRSAWVTVAKEIFGLAAPPSALSNVTLQSAGGMAVLKWAMPLDLDVRVGGQIAVRHSAAGVPAWANSVSMDSVPGSTTLAVVPLKPGAYIVRAVDSSGIMGPETVLRTDGVQVIPFAPLNTLQEDTTFTGAKTNAIVDSGTLRLDLSGNVDAEPSFDLIPNLDGLGGVNPTGTYQFASALNFGSVKRARLRSVIDLTATWVLDNIDTRPGSIDEWINLDGVGGGEVDCRVEFRTTQTNPIGSPVWSDWGRVENTEIQAWGVQARAMLTSNDAGFTPAISQLRLVAEEAI